MPANNKCSNETILRCLRHQRAGVRLALTQHGFTDRRSAVNAAWALSHLPGPDNRYIAEYRELLVELALTTPDTSLRRLSLALLERLEWGRAEVRTDLLDFCLDRLVRSDEPVGVRALCLKLAYSQCRHYPELCGELRRILLLMEPADLKPALNHIRMKTLKLL